MITDYQRSQLEKLKAFSQADYDHIMQQVRAANDERQVKYLMLEAAADLTHHERNARRLQNAERSAWKVARHLGIYELDEPLPVYKQGRIIIYKATDRAGKSQAVCRDCAEYIRQHPGASPLALASLEYGLTFTPSAVCQECGVIIYENERRQSA